jgi:hypothetical protein
MKTLKLCLALFLLLATGSLAAQEVENPTTSTAQTQSTPKKNSFFKLSNLTYGGGFGLHLNKYEFNVMLMPEVGYRLFPQWKIAVAPMYSYYGYWDSYYNGSNEHVAGLRISTHIDLNGYKSAPRVTIFIHASYQYEHHWWGYQYRNEYDANFADLGLGVRIGISAHASMYVMAYWHAYASHSAGNDHRYDRSWFPDLIPNLSVGIEVF